MRNSIILLLAVVLALASGACNSAPGRPALDSQVLPPDRVLNFDILYQQNCAGCHGVQGKGGAAVGLASPVYLAIADDATIRRVTAEGVPGTAMPAFAQSAGGLLTAEQVDVVVKGIRARWAKPTTFGDVALPSYAAQAPGDAKRGASTYAVFCAS